ncbi:hypothetical protein [Mangrovicoccus ximenensis]|uniref:hypothetical protein n=1 Tax=Mangrovicoccus ximenensis TaxID=1911570 RepID=UPI000D365A55|nr:hypothetical protein [Mangrovicoccus ximenensis]
MTRNILLAAAGAAILGLSACDAPAPSGSGTESVSYRTAPRADEQVCRAATLERAAASSVTILSSETSQANNLVMLRDSYGVTWRCLVNGGAVVELSAP